MGNGSIRSTFCGASLARGVAAWAVCALLLSGCETVNDMNLDFWPFNQDQAGGDGAAAGGGDEAVTAPADGEVALHPALVTKVQTKLAELGYEPGPIDGQMGPKTRAALRRYQMVEGLPVDGRVTQPVLVRLTGEPAAKPASAEPDGEADAGTAKTAEAPAAGKTAGIALGPAPIYQAGSRYVYADGEVRTVISVDDGLVTWQSNRDGYSVSRNNFLVPSLSWASSETSGKRSLNEAAGDLWPRDGGKEIAFTTTALVEYKTRPDDGSELSETWHCRVGGAKQTTVPAGTFQTREITCDGLDEPDGTSRQRTWQYAPEIGHYVSYEETGGSHPAARRSELLAIVPSTADWPPVAQAGLGWALEHALETSAPGERTDWTSSAVDVDVTIEPGPTVSSGEHETCRTFTQIWSQPGGRQIYPGLSCREAAGRWIIPGLEGGVALAKGVE